MRSYGRVKNRYRTLIENANEAIFVIQNGRISYANPKLEEIGKFTAEELAQKPFLEFVHPDDRIMVGEYHKRRLTGEPLNNRYVFRIVSKEGSSTLDRDQCQPDYLERTTSSPCLPLRYHRTETF